MVAQSMTGVLHAVHSSMRVDGVAIPSVGWGACIVVAGVVGYLPGLTHRLVLA